MIEILKVTIVFAAIILLMGRKIPVGVSMLGGSILLALLDWLPIQKFLIAVKVGAIGYETLNLVAVVLLIFTFEAALSETGQIERISNGFKKLVTDSRLVVAAIPALIGVLPMPGGALFSAPAMKSAGAELNTTPEEQTFLNYWFRHVWEYVWPLYPGVIFASKLAKIPLPELMAVQSPLTAAAILSGALILATRVRRAPPAVKRDRHYLHQLWVTTVDLIPVWFIIIALLSGLLDILPTMFIALAIVLAMNRTPVAKIPNIVRKGISWEGLLLVVGVMIFVQVLQASGSVRLIGIYLGTLGIGLLPLFVLIPFIAGMLTGSTMAYLGISLPILLPMIPDSGWKAGYLMVAYGCGYVGILLSPFHLCLVLTVQYFGAQLRGVYRILWLPSAFVVLIAIVTYWFGKFWGISTH